jgi:signal transduction histidine kinase
MKTQQKIALLLISTSLLMFLFFGGSIYYFIYNYSFEDFYKRLKARATFAAQYNLDVALINPETVKKIREQHLEKLTEEKEYFYLIKKETNLRELAQKADLPKSFLDNILKSGVDNLKINDTFYTGIKHVRNNEIHIVIVSAKNYHADRHLSLMRNIILIGIVSIVSIVAYLSFYFSKHIFDPIKNITDKVKQISSENIHLRIEERNDDVEISQLISTFNDLLNRLETTFEIQKNFISNASHEFGTPLTSIMGEAEVILMKDRSIDDYKQSLQSILEQAERLNQITQTLLYLAQTGYTDKSVKTELVRTDELIWHSKAIVDKLNPKNKIQVDISLLPENPKKLKVNGNKELLSIAITNLLTNAYKYSNNKTVYVSIASSDNHIFIVIKDDGIGIPELELPYVFNPFFRASNTQRFEGHGIGLPLTRNIIKIHNGQLSISSIIDVGTTVQVKLPQAKIV